MKVTHFKKGYLKVLNSFTQLFQVILLSAFHLSLTDQINKDCVQVNMHSPLRKKNITDANQVSTIQRANTFLLYLFRNTFGLERPFYVTFMAKCNIQYLKLKGVHPI